MFTLALFKEAPLNKGSVQTAKILLLEGAHMMCRSQVCFDYMVV